MTIFPTQPIWKRLTRVGVAALGVSLALGIGAAPAFANASADAQLFSATNQDRASNGVAALADNATLSSIGEDRPYTGCGFVVNGRAEDLIVRNYFSHIILDCNEYVFSIMKANGINYTYAGENIGWVGGAGDNSAGIAQAVPYVNTSFMNSTDHRANILNIHYTQLGIGSWFANSWYSPASCAGCLGTGNQSSVWMFTEEFAALATSPTPKPTVKPTVKPTIKPTVKPTPTPQRTATPPPTSSPSSPPATSSTTPTSSPSPHPTLTVGPSASASPLATQPPHTPLPTPAVLQPPSGAPPAAISSGWISSNVDSILEGYLG